MNNKNFRVPQPGDMLCIRHADGSWAYSGDKFVRFENKRIIARQTFANGRETFTEGDETKFRLLIESRLFHIQIP